MYGKFEPTEVIVLLSIVLLSFPVVVPVDKKMTPEAVAVSEPDIVQYFRIFDVASLINLNVEVPAIFEVLVFEIVRSFPIPKLFRLPSIVTLSAPFKSINGVLNEPLIVLPVTVGYIETEV